MSDLEEVQLMVTSDAAKTAVFKRGHSRTGSTGSAKSGSHLYLFEKLLALFMFVT